MTRYDRACVRFVNHVAHAIHAEDSIIFMVAIRTCLNIAASLLIPSFASAQVAMELGLICRHCSCVLMMRFLWVVSARTRSQMRRHRQSPDLRGLYRTMSDRSHSLLSAAIAAVLHTQETDEETWSVARATRANLHSHSADAPQESQVSSGVNIHIWIRRCNTYIQYICPSTRAFLVSHRDISWAYL
jgi:hypothetical protein